MMIRYLLLYMHSRATALIADLSSGVASFFLLALAVRSLILSAACFVSLWFARLRALRSLLELSQTTPKKYVHFGSTFSTPFWSPCFFYE